MGRPNKFGFEYNGVYRTSAEWGKVLGMRTDVINHRIRRGWTLEEIVGTPLGESRRNDICDGCKYWREMNGMEGSKTCHYFLDTGTLRSVPYEKCERRKRHAEEIAATVPAG